MGYIDKDYLKECCETKSLAQVLEELTTEVTEIYAASASANKRGKFLKSLEDTFAHDYYTLSARDLDESDIAALATIVVAPRHPNWTKENCEEFYCQTKNTVINGQKIIGMSDAEALKALLGINSKEEGDTCGTDRKSGGMSDYDVVQEFLKSIMR